ncbi:MAG: O-antigen ligase family protein [Coriobacteriia bacterium]|nr:O-antigen ligase family protein [Coriobacteriia bacterium]
MARIPLLIVAGMVVLVILVSGNLSAIGVGGTSMLSDPIALPRLAIAAVLVCAAWLAWFAIGMQDGPSLRFDLVWAALAALACWAMLSTALSPHRLLAVLGQSERLEGAVSVVIYCLLYGIGLQVVRHVRAARVLATAVVVSAAVLALYGVAQWMGIDPANYTWEGYGFSMRRAFATMGNPNYLAGLLVLALPISIMLTIGSQATARRWAWGGATMLVGGALFLTFTRAAWLAAALEVILISVYYFRSRARDKGLDSAVSSSGPVLAVASAVLVILVIVSVWGSAETNVVSRVQDALALRNSAGERVLTARIALDAAATRPVFGYGPDAFLPAFRLHRTEAYVDEFGVGATSSNAHSWPLQYAATVGFVGALLLVTAIVLGLVRSRRYMSSASTNASGLLMAGIWIGCLGFVVDMLFNVAVLGATVPFWVLLGVLGAPSAPEVRLGATWRWLGAAVFAVATGAAILAAGSVVSADVAHGAATAAFLGETDRDARTLALRARTSNPTSVKYAGTLAQVSADRVFRAIAGEAPPETVRALYEIADADFTKTLEMHPADYHARAWYAAMQAYAGGYLKDSELLKQSAETAGRAQALDRHHDNVRALASGDTSIEAIQQALGVPRLP